jgi:heme/copper-type cytochrome/quinol oxidase subunit 2
MKKLLSVTAVVLLAACSSPTADTIDDGDSSSSRSASIIELDSSSSESSAPAADPTAAASSAPAGATTSSAGAGNDTAAGTRVIEVSVTDWSFSPAAITAKKGENVVIRLTGVQGRHSLAIPELGVNVAIEAGQTVDVTVPTDTAGTFALRCAIPCGPGHRDMVGSIVIS